MPSIPWSPRFPSCPSALSQLDSGMRGVESCYNRRVVPQSGSHFSGATEPQGRLDFRSAHGTARGEGRDAACLGAPRAAHACQRCGDATACQVHWRRGPALLAPNRFPPARLSIRLERGAQPQSDRATVCPGGTTEADFGSQVLYPQLVRTTTGHSRTDREEYAAC